MFIKLNRAKEGDTILINFEHVASVHESKGITYVQMCYHDDAAWPVRESQKDIETILNQAVQT